MTIILNVPDMSCGHCIKTIETAVRGLDAAASVRADLAAKTIAVDSSIIAVTDISQALDAAGYPNSPARD